MKLKLRLVPCAAAFLLASACVEDDATGPGAAVSMVSYDVRNQSAIDTLAKGIALALRDSTLRVRIIEDMRDSPFPQHSLPLRAYLQGPRGASMAAAVRDALKVGSDDLSALLASVPEVAFQAATREDRATWTGSGAFSVAGSMVPLEQLEPTTVLTSFSSDGRRVSVPLTIDPRAVLLTIAPPRFSFGQDPEVRRAAAPRQSRRTISTWGAEVGIQNIAPCVDCQASTGPEYNPLQGLSIGSDCEAYTMTLVDASTDQDRDGYKDDCEARLAEAFRPLLVLHRGEELGGRETYWSVQQAYGVITIIYLLGYYSDGGSFSHDGDSEFIILRLTADKGTWKWKVNRMITSAHWNAAVDNTKSSNWDGIQWESTPGGRPVVYVSKDHHANYETESRCDARIGDVCDPRSIGFHSNVYVAPDRNIGTAAYPFRLDARLTWTPADCTMSKVSTQAHPGIECFFSTTVYSNYEGTLDDFSGWSGKRTDTTHYSKILSAYAMM